jgi:hypothetical protein
MKRICSFLAAISLATAPLASAQTVYSIAPFNFDGPGGLTSPILDGAEFSLTVSSGPGDSFLFQIANISDPNHPNVTAFKPTITGIYFDDDALLVDFSSYTIFDSVGTIDFSPPPPGPVNVPGGNEIGFYADFGLRATPPPTTNGVDPGEFITLQFNALGGATYADTVSALNIGTLRTALHVQQLGIGDDTKYSAGFVNVVPEPGAALLIAISGLLGILRRRRGAGF